MFKCTYVVFICPCPTVSKQKPVDGSHTSHHHLLRSGLGGGGFDLFYEAPYTLVFKSGALKAAQPSSLHIWSDLSSRMPCHPKHSVARGSSLTSPSHSPAVPQISLPQSLSPSSNSCPVSILLHSEALQNDATAHRPPQRSLRPGCLPINIYSFSSSAPNLTACLLHH